ncbi:formyltransferase family protein [Salinicoccus luteus]|uniref:formyltransferase family protein n=1 Tax=Salinicoccus luteus TaxID=367840 RepID=UPI00056B9304|nr:formyltransferase family protein [Salinicoccus luteus]
MKKTAFVTCVQLGLSCIEEIYNIGGKLDLLITLEDDLDVDKSGRIYLDDIAAKQDVPLLKIKNINDKVVRETLKEYEIDWLFIIGWSQIAKNPLLDTPKLGSIGMHPTLLPQGRGRAAIPWAIIKGLDKTGVTMFKLDEGVDTGEIIDQKEIFIDEDTTATTLYERINALHTELIVDNWNDIVNNKIELIEQNDEKATVWPSRRPSDGEITSDMTMDEAERLVRATTRPYPGAFYKNGNVIYKIWSAKKNDVKGYIKLKDGYLELLSYEREEG